MSLRSLGARIYYRIGIHAAPPGTLLYGVHYGVRRVVNAGILRDASRDAIVRSPYGGTPWYSIERARRSRPVDGLALIFFIGVGDYLMATPMIESLRLAHMDLPIYAYASTSSDSHNSSLVADLLRTNPAIDKVFTYRGRSRHRWVDYDFRDALQYVPKNFLVLPVVYETVPSILHRETTLHETFGLPVTLPVRGPVLNTANEPSPAAEAVLETVRAQMTSSSARRLVCCHLDARSSGYLYPEMEALLNGLIAENCLVVHFGESGMSSPALVNIEVSTTTLNDTISLLSILKNDGLPLCFLSVNSLMWPISAGLGVPNLGIHVFFDESIHQYLYPNIFVVSQHNYPRVSPSRLFLAPYGSYKQSRSRSGVEVVDYTPAFIVNCFRRFLEINQV
jgi:hypothetical protein